MSRRITEDDLNGYELSDDGFIITDLVNEVRRLRGLIVDASLAAMPAGSQDTDRTKWYAFIGEAMAITAEKTLTPKP